MEDIIQYWRKILLSELTKGSLSENSIDAFILLCLREQSEESGYINFMLTEILHSVLLGKMISYSSFENIQPLFTSLLRNFRIDFFCYFYDITFSLCGIRIGLQCPRFFNGIKIYFFRGGAI